MTAAKPSVVSGRCPQLHEREGRESRAWYAAAASAATRCRLHDYLRRRTFVLRHDLPDRGTERREGYLVCGSSVSRPRRDGGLARIRPDVAQAFDRMAAAARADGVQLLVNSGFRSDAEQAILFARRPDPKRVAPRGQSLHRYAT